MTVDFTPEEAQACINLLDAAVRAQGLQAAQVALQIVQKIQAAAQATVPEPAKDSEE